MPLHRPLPNTSKIEAFDGKNFRHWQDLVYSVLDMHGVVDALEKSKPANDTAQTQKDFWQHANKKLLESWSAYKQQLKHKQKQLLLSDLITHIIIEDTNRKTIQIAKGKKMTAKANLVESHKRTAKVQGKGKINLKLTSGKTLQLSDVLYVPEIRANLICVALVGMTRIKDVAATSEYAWAPLSGVLPDNIQESQWFQLELPFEFEILGSMSLTSSSNNNDNVDDKVLTSEDDNIFDMTVCAAGIVVEYYLKYCLKTSSRTSSHTGFHFVREILEGHCTRCYEMFRMEKHVLIALCRTLQEQFGLEPTKGTTIEEMVAMFLMVVGHGIGNGMIQERFQISGETVSKYFHRVLKACLKLAMAIIKPKDPFFSNVHPKLRNDDRYWPYFKDCIGTAHDARIFDQAIRRQDLNFPHPPPPTTMAIHNFIRQHSSTDVDFIHYANNNDIVLEMEEGDGSSNTPLYIQSGSSTFMESTRNRIKDEIVENSPYV
ncbi:putative harbinger transposase-derived nuclease domain-containing protein [Senna tora]|uniref:Putative harbinger transposase-derived nuclease domain-containing protein n=1 Tax=Senna tora TaxID=362788 RepID=A0A834W8H0_9FABA|nr:putative harbinger transposase-derived nuclease domain-containing protein [Senna tora]